MKKQEKQSKGFTSGYVMVNRRVNSSHPLFKGDGYALAIFIQLVTNMAYERTTNSLGKTENRVPLERTQVLTSYRTLMKVLGFSKWVVESRIKKLVEGVPNVCKGIINKLPCENMPGLTRNDGMVITILGGAHFKSEPDTSQDAKPDKSNNSSSKTKSVSIELPGELDTPEFREAWGDFVVHRKQKDAKGKAMTERSAKMVLNKLVKANLTPGEAVAELNKAIECNWLTVWSKEPTAKVVKRTGKSSNKQTGPEAMQERDKAACRRKAA